MPHLFVCVLDHAPGDIHLSVVSAVNSQNDQAGCWLADKPFGPTRAAIAAKRSLAKNWKMEAMVQETKDAPAPDDVERRRHTRYRLVEKLLIRRNGDSSYQATTSEISISGLSASTTGILRVGEEVRLSPVAGMQVNAIIRRRLGTIYGFEFSVMPPTLEEEIHK